MNGAMRLYLAEFVGTFTLVFVGIAVATLQGFFDYGQDGFLVISCAFGFTLMVLVLVIGLASGCHVNPAITIPMALSGRLKGSNAPGYIISQILGALVASAVLLFLLEELPDYELTIDGLGTNGNPHDVSMAALFFW